MIGRLRGPLVDRRESLVIVECGGVGYAVTVSVHTLLQLPPLGQEVTLRVFTHMVENRISLYGFGSAGERELFDLLITVKNVGPASAMGILSGGVGPLEIAQLIAGEQTAALTKLKGVGKKTAEMLVVELHEKCQELLATWGAQGVTNATGDSVALPPVRSPLLDDVASALSQLGWRPAEVSKVVAELVVEEGDSFESLLRDALRSMPR